MKVFIDDVIVEGETKGQIFIESDVMSFQVVKYAMGKNKDGEDKETQSTLGHFSNVGQCVKFVALNVKVKESTATTLGELVRDVARIEQYIADRINF